MDENEYERSFTSCKVCNWRGKLLQKHLKNQSKCSQQYDMDEVNKFFSERAAKKKKERDKAYKKSQKGRIAEKNLLTSSMSYC